MKDYSLEDLKYELLKIESWKQNAKNEKDLMTVNYFYNITKKMIDRLENETAQKMI